MWFVSQRFIHFWRFPLHFPLPASPQFLCWCHPSTWQRIWEQPIMVCAWPNPKTRNAQASMIYCWRWNEMSRYSHEMWVNWFIILSESMSMGLTACVCKTWNQKFNVSVMWIRDFSGWGSVLTILLANSTQCWVPKGDAQENTRMGAKSKWEMQGPEQCHVVLSMWMDSCCALSSLCMEWIPYLWVPAHFSWSLNTYLI